MVICNKQQLKGLMRLKKFVEDCSTITNKQGIISIIDDALTEGCYSSYHQKKLNQIRNVWFDQTYAGEFICRHCLEDTSQVDYDYLSGTDHLECVLKEEIK
jgi:hypothetical protein